VRLQSAEARRELDEFRGLEPVFQSVELVPPTITFSQSMTIYGGDLTIELLAAPGHQPDQIAAWIPELRLLLAFDAVEYPLPSVDGARGVPHMFATLERLGALPARRVLCSHGKTGDPVLVQANLAYLREIERRSRVYLSGHRPGEQEPEHASQLIGFPFNEVIADMQDEFDRGYYSQAHEENCGAVLSWLMTYSESA
jgi:glyoxylase-like metal-dependent hydrolase (beta-lactamase superfamily II)